MDEFTVSNLYESRNEWCARLVTILVPLLHEGIRSIFNESYKMCLENNELSKYLMTFQNLLSRIPKWNEIIIENEKNRIIEKSNCNYLEDLITCVHVVQLKILTYMRVGNTQKQIEISIPKIDTFIHKVYIHIARRLYSSTYLFEYCVSKLQSQKNNREIDRIIQECLILTIRDSIPTEDIIRQYTDESVEHDEEVTIEHIAPPPPPPTLPTTALVPDITSVAIPIVMGPNTQPPLIHQSTGGTPSITDSGKPALLKFNDYDNVLDSLNNTNVVCVPKHASLIEPPLQTKLHDISNIDDTIYNRTDTSMDLSDIVMVKGSTAPSTVNATTASTISPNSTDDFLILDDVEVIK
jgi:hypothetical protein